MRIIVVGAGLAGLSAARILATTHDVIVVDKGRGVGGRMATRRIDHATFDHGAQFFTTHTAEFAAVVDEWRAAGLVQPWFAGRIGPHGIIDADGHTRFRGADNMNAIAKHLAAGLDVRVQTHVKSVSQRDQAWLVTTNDNTFEADAVMLTAPVPQSLALLDSGRVPLTRSDLADLKAIRYEPCIALLAVLKDSPSLPEPGAVDPIAGPIDWMADNQRKGVSAVPALTIHADADFSHQHWDSSDDVVVHALLAAASVSNEAIAGSVQVQRWRYARPIAVHASRHLVAHNLAPLIFAGDGFGGAKVEGAVLSGRSAAHALMAELVGALHQRA
jgi:renalase